MQVLRFFAYVRESLWEAVPEGSIRRCVILYYLEDATLAINNHHQPGSGLSHGPILKRHKCVTAPPTAFAYKSQLCTADSCRMLAAIPTSKFLQLTVHRRKQQLCKHVHAGPECSSRNSMWATASRCSRGHITSLAQMASQEGVSHPEPLVSTGGSI